MAGLLDLPREILCMVEDRIKESERGGMMALMAQEGLGLSGQSLTGVWTNACDSLGVKKTVEMVFHESRVRRKLTRIDGIVDEKVRMCLDLEMEPVAGRMIPEIMREVCHRGQDAVVVITNGDLCECSFGTETRSCKHVGERYRKWMKLLLKNPKVPAALVFKWTVLERREECASCPRSLLLSEILGKGERTEWSCRNGAFFNFFIRDVPRGPKRNFHRLVCLCQQQCYFILSVQKNGVPAYGICSNLDSGHVRLT